MWEYGCGAARHVSIRANCRTGPSNPRDGIQLKRPRACLCVCVYVGVYTYVCRVAGQKERERERGMLVRETY